MNLRKKRSKALKQTKILITLIIITVILIFGLVSAILYNYSNNIMANLIVESFTPQEIGISQQVSEDFNQYSNKITNILLIGIDSDLNQGLPQRSDSMIIVTIDDLNNTIKMSSLMRDTLVEIESYGKDKLNHAYAYGGAKLLLKTINQNFELNIQEYVLVNFNDLISIVDAIGGIDLYITKDEVHYANIGIRDINTLNNATYPVLEPKSQKLRVNGTQALSYARIRSLDSDYKRAERQRIVLTQIYERLVDIPLTDLPEITLNLSKYVKTTLNQTQIIDISRKALGSQMVLKGIRFPTENTSEESTKGMWHLKWEKETTIMELHNWIFRNILPSTQNNP